MSVRSKCQRAPVSTVHSRALDDVLRAGIDIAADMTDNSSDTIWYGTFEDVDRGKLTAIITYQDSDEERKLVAFPQEMSGDVWPIRKTDVVKLKEVKDNDASVQATISKFYSGWNEGMPELATRLRRMGYTVP